jgi:hypothetical protein
MNTKQKRKLKELKQQQKRQIINLTKQIQQLKKGTATEVAFAYSQERFLERTKAFHAQQLSKVS